MVELKFIGTPAEIKAEIKEFIGLENITVHENTVPKKENKETPVQLPVKESMPVKETGTVLPTLPTASTEYTDGDIQRIAGGLIKKNAALTESLINTLGNYGVQAITHLPKEHYGAFVQDLIALGADV